MDVALTAARRRHSFRFFKGSGPVAEPRATPGPDPASALPAPPEPLPPSGRVDASPAPAASPGTPGPGGEAPPKTSPYLEALEKALATNDADAWAAVNEESERLEAEERKAFESYAKVSPPPPQAPSRREVPPAPERRFLYVSPLARASREAYDAAPPEIRAALDGLFSIRGVHRLARNAWSGNVGAWTSDGSPSPAGNAYLAAHGELAPWTLSLKAASYMPKDAGAQYLTREELAASAAASPADCLPGGRKVASVEEGRNG